MIALDGDPEAGAPGTCGVNLVGGSCPFARRDDDPLCLHHARAVSIPIGYVSATEKKALRGHMNALRNAGATMPKGTR